MSYVSSFLHLFGLRSGDFMLRHIVGILINAVFIYVFVNLISLSVQTVVSSGRYDQNSEGKGCGRRRS